MSKNTQERHKQRTAYFDYLRETSKPVDAYVRQKLLSMSILSEKTRARLSSLFRFDKGKLRPATVRMAYELLGGVDFDEVVPAAAAMEVKDTGYYCLDRYFDRNEGSDNIILAGIFSSLSREMINDLKEDARTLAAIHRVLLDLDIQNAEAALLDISGSVVDEETYMHKAEGYNFWEHAFRVGGLLAKADTCDLDTLGEAGKRIGIGHIVANDTWDYGTESMEDYKAGKHSLASLKLEEEHREKPSDKLGEWFRRFGTQQDLTDEILAFVRNTIVQSGAIAHAKSVAAAYCSEGLELLGNLGEVAVMDHIRFATTMTQRNKWYDVLNKVS
ncbi:hypothetical protein KKC44_04610 [Patescibacteria group bacterium]|nr:hypothetical protein [Patescibacteria group bacterium]MBU2259859.1 hypothetical protein [Patescibacteria group bacterium]